MMLDGVECGTEVDQEDSDGAARGILGVVAGGGEDMLQHPLLAL